MRPITVTQTGAGASTPIPLDIRIAPFQVTVDCVLTGTATYSVQYTDDDIWADGYNPASGNWYAMTDLSSATASKIGTLISPVRAVRLVVESGAGSVAARIIQAGN